ncbi:flagellar biosynthetic protein FliQ [Albidovulum sp.]|mgnify:FL=1|uniref:flagellar biosynthetic protein FliQ n=1 Tax=Albidovulum sp. TaxID=1872424 RepID=UPI001DF79436|nr:flagellar biosynthetic protein FliQ [Paracoccaceae bacterium]MCC0045931.1 flagellar biosynthetic protein FliQ [Defluviimonas sp.]HPE23985.1 flagellar biosynthetic protein FliQ [Albidovulum sp.]MCB2120774.1 flagellar biosynthetic protein FliQ [Paracoccaceae bacterium]MCB2122397.1 flagellar biosynthetic protein FliQ [Paracoccaceae bacterium]
MLEAAFFDILRQTLWTATATAAPLLSVALVVGVVIGLLQALTAVQEATLTFVPKLAAMMAVFWASMTFMSLTIVDFFVSSILPLIERS